MTSHAPQTGRYGKYLALISTILEFLALNGAYLITTAIGVNQRFETRAVWLAINLVYLLIVSWSAKKNYTRSTTMEHVITVAFKQLCLHALLFIPIMYFLDADHIIWRALLKFYVITLTCLIAEKVIFQIVIHIIRSKGYNYASVVIVGEGQLTERLSNYMHDRNNFGYKIDAYFGPSKTDNYLGQFYKGTVSDLEAYLTSHKVDEIYYSSSHPSPEDITKVAQLAESQALDFYFVPQIPRGVIGRFQVSSLGAIPVMELMETPLRSRINAFIKRAFDMLVSGVAILVLAPLVFIPVAIAIKRSSPGPIFFRQKRTGLKGSDFWCYKFRTMKVNADSDKAQATKDDPRKTKVGEFLRHSSIDELPQLINVFKGDMSLVGPRPHMLAHTEQYSELIDKYMVRHAVRPGITGWAQVNGYRGLTDELWKMEGRVEHDIWYIEHWSFLLDLKIMFKTVINAVKGEENAF